VSAWEGHSAPASRKRDLTRPGKKIATLSYPKGGLKKKGEPFRTKVARQFSKRKKIVWVGVVF